MTTLDLAARAAHLICVATGLGPVSEASFAGLLAFEPLEPGDTVALGAEGAEVFFILSGAADLSRAVAGDGAIDLMPISPGRIHGLAGIFVPTGPALGTLMARAPAELCRMDAGALRAAAEGNPALALDLLRLMATELWRAEQPQAHEIDGARRLHRLLVELARPAGDHFLVEPLPRHAELAERAGTSDHEAARIIGALIERDIAQRGPRRLRIKDMGALRALT